MPNAHFCHICCHGTTIILHSFITADAGSRIACGLSMFSPCVSQSWCLHFTLTLYHKKSSYHDRIASRTVSGYLSIHSSINQSMKAVQRCLSLARLYAPSLHCFCTKNQKIPSLNKTQSPKYHHHAPLVQLDRAGSCMHGAARRGHVVLLDKLLEWLKGSRALCEGPWGNSDICN